MGWVNKIDVRADCSVVRGNMVWGWVNKIDVRADCSVVRGNMV